MNSTDIRRIESVIGNGEGILKRWENEDHILPSEALNAILVDLQRIMDGREPTETMKLHYRRTPPATTT